MRLLGVRGFLDDVESDSVAIAKDEGDAGGQADVPAMVEECAWERDEPA